MTWLVLLLIVMLDYSSFSSVKHISQFHQKLTMKHLILKQHITKIPTLTILLKIVQIHENRQTVYSSKTGNGVRNTQTVVIVFEYYISQQTKVLFFVSLYIVQFITDNEENTLSYILLCSYYRQQIICLRLILHGLLIDVV